MSSASTSSSTAVTSGDVSSSDVSGCCDSHSGGGVSGSGSGVGSDKPVALPRVVSLQEWEAAHAALVLAEKAATRARDLLAAERRRAPMVEIERLGTWKGKRRRITRTLM